MAVGVLAMFVPACSSSTPQPTGSPSLASPSPTPTAGDLGLQIPPKQPRELARVEYRNGSVTSTGVADAKLKQAYVAEAACSAADPNATFPFVVRLDDRFQTRVTDVPCDGTLTRNTVLTDEQSGGTVDIQLTGAEGAFTAAYAVVVPE